MSSRILRALPAAAMVSAILAAPSLAAANGVFPNAGQIAVDPTDPQHIVVRTTYGILTTREGGEPWDWICESAVGYGSGFHPAIALTANGTLVAGLADGLGFASADTCGWSKVSGGLDGLLVVDVSLEKSDLSHAVLVTSGGAAGAGQLWTSDDNAATWVKTGVDLPAGFEPLTLDVAPSDPMRVYVTAQIGAGSTKKGTLFVSDDRGMTWAQFSVPNTDLDHAPYIGGIDPADPDRVFVRNDGMPGRLFLFDRATGTFTPIFTGTGILRGFALSPDGATMLVGGSSDGIWRAATDTLDFEQRSNVATRCLTWTAAGVYSCATEFADGFTIGLSVDEGATFDPVMHLPCVRGPLECGPETIVGAQCPAEWPAVALQIDADTCDSGSGGGGGSSTGGGGGAGGSGAQGGSGATGGNTGAAGSGPGGDGSGASGGSSSGGDADPPSDAGCSCSLGRTWIPVSPRGAAPVPSPHDRAGSEHPRGASPGAGTFASLALALLVFRRGRRRATPRA